PRSIDDVPILALTFWSHRYDDLTLRQIAAQVDDTIKQTPGVSAVEILGGQRRILRVEPDPEKLAARGLTPLDVANAVGAANQKLPAGVFHHHNLEIL